MKKIVDVWVTRDALSGIYGPGVYYRWNWKPEYDQDNDVWLIQDGDEEHQGRRTTERHAVKLIGCKMKGGPRSIRRVKRPGRGEESK